jgi:hypothetical protein
MPKFALAPIEGLPPKPAEPFFKLLINGRCAFDEFWSQMEKSGNQRKSLDRLQAFMVLKSNGERLPVGKFKMLKGRKKGDVHPDFEFKVDQLRLYLFEDKEAGKVIVLGELKKGKNTQDRAIAHLRAIKLAYFVAKGQ